MTDLQRTIEYIFKLSNDVSAQAGQASQSAQSAKVAIDDMNGSVERSEQVLDGVQSTLDTVGAKARETSNDVSAQAGQASQSAQNAAQGVQRATDEIGMDLEDMTAQARSKASEIEAIAEGAKDSVADAKRQVEQIDLLTQLTSIMGIREGVSAVTGGIIGLGIVSDETAQDLNKVNAAFSVMAGAITMIKSLQAVMTTLNATEAVGAVLASLRTAVSSPVGAAIVGTGIGVAAGLAGGLLLTSNTTNNNSTTINVSDTTPQQATSEIFTIVAGGAL